MWLLFKALLAILILTTGMVSLAAGQRLWVDSYVIDVLAVEKDCGQNCWFRVALDGSMGRKQVNTALAAFETEALPSRGSLMRFLLYDSGQDPAIGSVQVRLQNGVAGEVCFFSRTFTLADVVAAFGDPVAFWIDSSRSRFSRSNLGATTLETFEMVYDTPPMHVLGSFEMDADAARLRLPQSARVDSLCTPYYLADDRERPQPLVWPEWRGFGVPVETYVANPVR